MALRAAYLAMHRRSDAHFAPFGVTADQFVLLNALANGDALTQRELARRTASDPNTVRAMLILLEARGFVARSPHPTDGRARTTTLTTQGKRLYRRLWVAGEPVRAAMLSALEPTEVESLQQLLTRLTRTLTKDQVRHPTRTQS